MNDEFIVSVPATGGTLSEGIVGIPRFINPLLAFSDADRDMTALIYSGLLKLNANGNLVPDLAKSYKISPDGLTYDFILKDNIYFQDGIPVTASDVKFTIEKAQDPALKSPKRPDWDKVGIEQVSDKEIKFILKQPYASFVENLTLGIIPSHIWKNISVEQFPYSKYTSEPIGSGPYQIKTTARDSGGLLVYYELSPFKKYALGTPHIANLILRFYNNEDDAYQAYKTGDVESLSSISPTLAKEIDTSVSKIETVPLPRVLGVFFNQNQAPVLANKEVRQALDTAIDREKIVNEVLKGYAVPITGPIPPDFIDNDNTTSKLPLTTATSTEDLNIASAKQILTKAGWKIGTDGIFTKTVAKKKQILSFTISTTNIPELNDATNIIASEWQKMGAKVDVKAFESSDLNQNVIRPRKYDALFFGEIVGRDLDLFAFWHSSQRLDPGLNIAQYTNSTVDKILDDARKISDKEIRISKYQKFTQEISKDKPAVFAYSPDFIYVIPKKVRGFSLSNITTADERFATINDWYIETDSIWSIFNR